MMGWFPESALSMRNAAAEIKKRAQNEKTSLL
jgi:hypothetical protein